VEETREEERNARRRTSSYYPALGPHHTDASVFGHESHGYPVTTLAPVNHAPTQHCQNFGGVRVVSLIKLGLRISKDAN
jgi:hypothetical protein